jgi:hypothetical protein
MKKLAIVLIVIALGISFAFANSNDDMTNNGKTSTETMDCKGDLRAEVLSADYEGSQIKVTVKLYGVDGQYHDVKVYPTNNGILSSVTASARTITLKACNCGENTGIATFPCSSQKSEDLQYCSAYNFAAKVLN